MKPYAPLEVRRPLASPDDAARFQTLRRQFPILARRLNGRPLVYLDTAASAQKPMPVLNAMRAAYEGSYANVHRGVHTLGQEATEAFEAARGRLARFINARSASEIVFVRGATEAINLVAATFGRAKLRSGDEIILSELEHHANIVPWQMLRDEKGVVLRVLPIDDKGDLSLERFRNLLTPRTKLVAITHVSNALGTIVPVETIIRQAHAAGAAVLVDGCQAVPHLQVDVQAIEADFYVFSGHKMYGPTGIGVLYGPRKMLEALPPYQGGGEMIVSVSFEETTFKQPPYRFEAGTPAIVEAIGLGAAADYLKEVGMERISAHERALRDYAREQLATIPGVRILRGGAHQAGIISFVLDGVHPHDIATILDQSGVAIRAGHHCAQPLMRCLGVPATARLSFGIYNTREDVDALIEALGEVRELFGG